MRPRSRVHLPHGLFLLVDHLLLLFGEARARAFAGWLMVVRAVVRQETLVAISREVIGKDDVVQIFIVLVQLWWSRKLVLTIVM